MQNISLFRADSRFAPSQWEMVLLCNDVSHWLGASLESALLLSDKYQASCTWCKISQNKPDILIKFHTAVMIYSNADHAMIIIGSGNVSWNLNQNIIIFFEENASTLSVLRNDRKCKHIFNSCFLKWIPQDKGLLYGNFCLFCSFFRVNGMFRCPRYEGRVRQRSSGSWSQGKRKVRLSFPVLAFTINVSPTLHCDIISAICITSIG